MKEINLTNIHDVEVSPSMKRIIQTIVASFVAAGLIVGVMDAYTKAQVIWGVQVASQHVSERDAINSGHAVEVRP